MKFLEAAEKVRSVTGKSVAKQIKEAAVLRLRKKPIGVSEYFEYSIWNPQLSAEEREQFIGWRQSHELDQQLNNITSRELANDKIITSVMLNNLRFPIPNSIATFSKHGRQVRSEPVLTNIDEVRQFLKENQSPFFVKPIAAGYGRGIIGVSDYDDSHSELILLDGQRMSLDKFFSDFNFPPYRGKLFQDCLYMHPTISKVTGTAATSCVRMICFLSPKGPIIHTAFWKIATGSNMTDNFSRGKFGNVLASINLETGCVDHAISHLGLDGDITHHPTSREKIIGFELPDWKKAMECVRKAAIHFPGLKLQNWDVALCQAGPVLVELNTEAELAIPQAICKRGLMDARLVDVLADIDSEREELRHSSGKFPDPLS